MQTAVLFIVFNRPDTTQQVFDAIRQARPPRLYVAADGPRETRSDEKQLCEEVRSIATAVDWPCEVNTLFRDENLGCGVAPSQAMNWFFDQEKSGIILEDDCVPDQTWFPFAQELLHRYRNDERVMNISALRFHPGAYTPLNSYFFSRYFHGWGWASWSRAWKHFDYDMRLWPVLRNTDWLLSVGDGSALFCSYWQLSFDSIYAGTQDVWDVQWTFSCWAQNGLTILPAKNLVMNIGFGDDATHTRSKNGIIKRLSLEKMEFPLIHPNFMVRDVTADGWSDFQVFGISRANSVKQTVLRLPGGRMLVKVARLLRGEK